MYNNKFRDFINFRDFGGYKTKDGRVIKSGLVFRSASPGFMNEEEFQELINMNFHTIFDLRSESEIKIHPYPDTEGTIKLQNSGVVSKNGESIDFSPAGMRRTGSAGYEQLRKLQGYYENIALGNHSFKVMFQELLQDHVPILIHCAAGKDRTGVASILFLLALGVDEETARYDYLLSNKYRKEILDETLCNIDKEKTPELYELMLMFDGVSENIFNAIIESIHAHYPTIEEFFEKEYDLDEFALETLRNKYLENKE